MNCTELRDIAPELALGALSGQERAAALDHLQGCPACQAEVDHLTAVADELVALAPAVEPPLGFEQRAVANLKGAGARGAGLPGRPGDRLVRRRWLPAAAAAVVLSVGAGGWAIGAHLTAPSNPGPALAEYPFTSGTATVGRVFASWGAQGWLFMSVDDPAVTGPVSCELVGTDGRVLRIGTFALSGGKGWWGAPLLVDRDQIRQARLVDTSGRVVATAAL